MTDKYIEHDFVFNYGDKVKHRTTNLDMAVVETKTNYPPPYKERIVCTYINSKNQVAIDEFYPTELELVKRKKPK
jgi:nitrate reductase alpha subunit